MTTKVEERGRGRFKPAPDYTLDDVKEILFEKIKEEADLIIDKPDAYKDDELVYKEGKANITSLFAGAGGLDLGVELAGLDVVLSKNKINDALKTREGYDAIRDKSVFHHVYANDIFNEALETYSMNFTDTVLTHKSDIKNIKELPKADLIVGGPPCPGYSAAGPRLVDDPRNFLYLHYIRVLMQVQPKFFILENVKGMMTLGKGEVFKQILEDFNATGYRIYTRLLNSRDYGVPQTRERVFLVGVCEDIDFSYEFPDPSHGEGLLYKSYVTLEDAICDLRENPGDYFTGSYSTIFMSRNRKKRWDEQSFTIQASGRQAPIHPSGAPMEKVDKNKWIFTDGKENNRRLSVKEIARIQTFPDWFEFSDGGNLNTSKNGRLDKKYKQIGNAVPVELARAVARPIAQWFYDNK